MVSPAAKHPRRRTLRRSSIFGDAFNRSKIEGRDRPLPWYARKQFRIANPKADVDATLSPYSVVSSRRCCFLIRGLRPSYFSLSTFYIELKHTRPLCRTASCVRTGKQVEAEGSEALFGLGRWTTHVNRLVCSAQMLLSRFANR